MENAAEDPDGGEVGGSGGGGGRVADKHGKKRYHRHTARQIQELERTFKQCPHPDENQRMRLSRELGLEPRQVKFWFQNRRTQMKAQHERADNTVLRAENEKIRCENLAYCEALKSVICVNCGGSPSGEMSFDEQQRLRMENARLKEELDRLSSIAAKYIGRPLTPLQPFYTTPTAAAGAIAYGVYGGAGPSSSSSLIPPPEEAEAEAEALDLQMGCGGGGGGGGAGAGAAMGRPLPLPLLMMMMMEVALSASHELVRLAQTDEPLWFQEGGRDVLHVEAYAKLFHSHRPPPMMMMMTAPHKSKLTNQEASRDSCLVMMSASALVDIFMDVEKWVEMFPTIVCRAKVNEVIVPGSPGNRHGSLQWMFAEVQVLSPLVQTREMQFLRYAHRYADGVWAVSDVSVNLTARDTTTATATAADTLAIAPDGTFACRRLPSGVVVQDMSSGYSKVTWVEHLEVEVDDGGVHRLYRSIVASGVAFGAQRWLATLRRMCERLASLLIPAVAVATAEAEAAGGGGAATASNTISSTGARRSIMDLSHNMMANFCANVGAAAAAGAPGLGCCSGSLSNLNWPFCEDDTVRITTRKGSNAAGGGVVAQAQAQAQAQPGGVVLCAATSLWLPLDPHRLFDFLTDVRARPEWDIHSNGCLVQEVAHVGNGGLAGNRISLLRVSQVSNCSSDNGTLILQECCSDGSGCMVVYSPVDVATVKAAMRGDDVSLETPVVPSGFVILPCAQHNDGNANPGGSLITLAFQIPVREMLSSGKLDHESVSHINDVVRSTVQRLKLALNCFDA